MALPWLSRRLIRWLSRPIITAHRGSRRVEQRHRLAIIVVRMVLNVVIAQITGFVFFVKVFYTQLLSRHFWLNARRSRAAQPLSVSTPVSLSPTPTLPAAHTIPSRQPFPEKRSVRSMLGLLDKGIDDSQALLDNQPVLDVFRVQNSHLGAPLISTPPLASLPARAGAQVFGLVMVPPQDAHTLLGFYKPFF